AMIMTMGGFRAADAQTVPRSATLAGSVKNTIGSAIAAVKLTLQSTDGKAVATTTTDDRGSFSFSAIKPGNYAIIAEKSGFKTATSIAVAQAGQTKTVAVSMESQQALSLPVLAKRLDRARNALSPITRGSSYTFNEKSLQQLPQGNNTPLNQV